MKLSNEFRVGVLSIVTIGLLIAGYNFLKGTSLFVKGKQYTIEYSYIPGLKKGDPVQINGYQIGRVTDITLPDAQKGVIEVMVNVTEDISIPKDSRAIIKSADLLGEKYVDMILGKGNQYYRDGDHITGEIEADLTNQIKEELRPLTEKVQSMIVSVDTAITVMSSIFTPSFKANFETSVANIKQTLESFNNSARVLDEMLTSQQDRIEGIITDVSAITHNVDANEKELDQIIDNLKSITDELAAVNWAEISTSLDTALTQFNEIMSAINNSEGSMGMLVNDPELYENLERITQTLDAITKELQQTPGKYVPPLIQIGGRKYSE